MHIYHYVVCIIRCIIMYFKKFSIVYVDYLKYSVVYINM